MDYSLLSVENTLKNLKSRVTGLTQTEAFERSKNSKQFEICEAKKSNIFIKFFSQFSDLMVLILLASSIISIIIGFLKKENSELVDGFIILGIVIINAILGAIQESKAEKSMEALKKISEPESRVVRDGKIIKENTKNLVQGDIIIFDSGSIIPADCRLIESHDLVVDESTLTGESLPVSKEANLIFDKEVAFADRKNMVYNGTVVARGRGLGVITKLGIQTELGKIAQSVAEKKKELTPLQKNIKDIGKILTWLILLMACVIFILEIIARGNILEGFLTAIAISVAAIPESMPAVITIIMSIGIARLAKQKVIIKKMHAVETLGTCDVICTDKTGTITQNKMSVQKVFVNGKICNEKSDMLLINMLLCNDVVKNEKYIGDPTEIALCEFADKYEYSKQKIESIYPRIDEIAFDSKRKMMTTLNKFDNKTIFCKGAIDAVIDKCNYIDINGKIENLTDEWKKKIQKSNLLMCEDALRVLAFAYRKNVDKISENNLVFSGMVGMIDPPRKEIVDAVNKCKLASMKPIMITGDYSETAFAIARDVGIARSKKEVMTGKEIDELSDEEFLKRIDKISVYARVSPENKARIVALLKEKGHIVAMTGDGVNDAPSLKTADIGIGMGESGTDVAKEVADMIFTDDNFASMIVAVKEGRNVYKNIQKTVKYLFSANMGEILSLFLMSVFCPTLVFLLPVQILFVNLITDSLPAIALGVEKEEKNLMREKPRLKGDGILSNGHGKELIFMGICQTLIILTSYFVGYKFGNEKIAMTMAFYTLNFIQLFYLFSARTEESIFKSNPFKNKLFNLSLIFGFGLLIVIALTPFHNILSLTNLPITMWIINILLSVMIIFISEIYKKYKNKERK